MLACPQNKNSWSQYLTYVRALLKTKCMIFNTLFILGWTLKIKCTIFQFARAVKTKFFKNKFRIYLVSIPNSTVKVDKSAYAFGMRLENYSNNLNQAYTNTLFGSQFNTVSTISQHTSYHSRLRKHCH